MDIQEKIDALAKEEGTHFNCNRTALENDYANLEHEEGSLAIKILSIFGGFLATSFFLSFVFASGLFDTDWGLITFGLIIIAFAVWLNTYTSKLIVDTISVCSYAAGFLMLGLGLEMVHVDENIIGLICIVLSLLTLIITQNYILSFISILFINGSLLFLIAVNEVFSFMHVYNAALLLVLTYFFLHEEKVFKGSKIIAKLYNPLRIGLLVSAICGLIFVATKNIFDINIYYVWISSLIIIPLNIYVISIIIKIIGVEKANTKTLVYVLSVLFLIPSVFSPALSGALLLILLCFFTNYKTGFALSVIAFIYFVGQYYYDLNYTLLTKSIILFASGMVFLLFYFFLRSKLEADEKI